MRAALGMLDAQAIDSILRWYAEQPAQTPTP
jgi:hypothetical protein